MRPQHCRSMYRALMLQAKLKAKRKSERHADWTRFHHRFLGISHFRDRSRNKRHRQCNCECQCCSDILNRDLVLYRSDRCMGNNNSTPVTPQTIYKAASANNVQLLIVSFAACKAGHCAFVWRLHAKLLFALSYGPAFMAEALAGPVL